MHENCNHVPDGWTPEMWVLRLRYLAALQPGTIDGENLAAWAERIERGEIGPAPPPMPEPPSWRKR